MSVIAPEGGYEGYEGDDSSFPGLSVAPPGVPPPLASEVVVSPLGNRFTAQLPAGEVVADDATATDEAASAKGLPNGVLARIAALDAACAPEGDEDQEEEGEDSKMEESEDEPLAAAATLSAATASAAATGRRGRKEKAARAAVEGDEIDEIDAKPLPDMWLDESADELVDKVRGGAAYRVGGTTRSACVRTGTHGCARVCACASKGPRDAQELLTPDMTLKGLSLDARRRAMPRPPLAFGWQEGMKKLSVICTYFVVATPQKLSKLGDAIFGADPSLERVRSLIATGHNIEDGGACGWQPLALAVVCEKPNLEVIKCIVAARADLQALLVSSSGFARVVEQPLFLSSFS